MLPCLYKSSLPFSLFSFFGFFLGIFYVRATLRCTVQFCPTEGLYRHLDATGSNAFACIRQAGLFLSFNLLGFFVFFFSLATNSQMRSTVLSSCNAYAYADI